jgi:hypothetical protein
MMNEIYVLPKDELEGELYRRIYILIRKNRWTRQSMVATFGLAGEILSILLGLLFWIVVGFLTQGSIESFLALLSNLFFGLPLPLLALGAYCLDLLEKRSPMLPLPVNSQPAGFERWHHL